MKVRFIISIWPSKTFFLYPSLTTSVFLIIKVMFIVVIMYESKKKKLKSCIILLSKYNHLIFRVLIFSLSHTNSIMSIQLVLCMFITYFRTTNYPADSFKIFLYMDVLYFIFLLLKI